MPVVMGGELGEREPELFDRVEGPAVAGAAGSVAAPLAHGSVLSDISMSIIAASMGYMFAGMQLMMSMPREYGQLAAQQEPTPGMSNSSDSGAGLQGIGASAKSCARRDRA
jgi:hypothetical protein